ncbi:hypothetical protein M0638_08040 [Roseomonas sp. NAR14]|uniref:Uncharacterized protein n=1 Tax=Roseomonas acroporae TaxID=2937791 RepID=A0A9X1Y6B0_9PROT|nr:hypothetical protein [Roseomonas acroporae]MCK8784326.1 hypothetical protein [Roseomonas acroporae]
MGGIFSSPKPTVVGPAAQPNQTVVTPVAAGPGPAQVASQGRVDAMDQVQRGMTGLIATAPGGVLSQAMPIATRKTLLGE